MRNRLRERQSRRSGCQTCKSRHKKCDEKRPVCGRCTRLDLECRPPNLFRATDPSRRKATSRHQPSPVTEVVSRDLHLIGCQDDYEDAVVQVSDDEYAETPVPNSTLSTPDTDIYQSQVVLAPISPQGSSFERQLLHHYVHTASKVLINVDGPSNPLRNVLVPRAASSEILMDALYANSAFHVFVCNQDRKMQNSSLLYYDKAASALSRLITSTGSQTTAGDLEILLLTTVFLCKYEILSVGSNWRPHLQAVQKMLKVFQGHKSNMSPETLSYVQSFITYHSCIAALTMTDQSRAPPTSSFEEEQDNADNHDTNIDPYMGVSGDLISLLHTAAETAMLDFTDGSNVLFATCTIIRIYERIQSDAKVSSSSSIPTDYGPNTIQQLDVIAHAYKDALIIYMHIILDAIAEASSESGSLLEYSHIRRLVAVTKEKAISACIENMLRIPDDDSCVVGLVPLFFIVASETKSPAEFETASTRLSAILKSACLGNVGTTLELLQKVHRVNSLSWRQVLKCCEWDLIVT